MMNWIYQRAIVVALMAALTACSSSTGSIESSPSGPGGVSKEYSAIVEQSVIDQLSIQFKMDPNDLESSNIQVQAVPGQATQYHATGDFVLSWTQPKNLGESAQMIAQRNICAVAPDHCKQGFRHTVYVDVIATADATGLTFTLAGDADIDQTIADAKRAAAEQAASQKRYEEQQAIAAQRQAEQQQAMEARRQEEAARMAEDRREKQALTQFDAGQRRELQNAIAELDAKHEQQRAALNQQMAQARRQLQAQQSMQRTGPMTIQLARQGQQQAGATYNQMADLDRQRSASYNNDNAERQALIAEIRTRQANERQQFIQQLQASAPPLPSASAPATAAVASQSQASTANQQPTTPVTSGSPSQGPSFDCAKASTPTEHAICNSAELSRLDSEVGTLYHQAMASAPPERRQAVKVDQQQWIVTRQRQCNADAQCIATSLQSRANQLRSGLQ